MKNYKFRIYDKTRNLMVYPDNYEIIRILFCYYDIMEIMMSTRVYDKKNNEIYEYDIVKSDYGYYYIVHYDLERIGFYPFSKGDGCGCCEIHTVSPIFCEVVGNIYETPELIKNTINSNILQQIN